MSVAKKRPQVGWWAVARGEPAVEKKTVLHATFGDDTSKTLCGLAMEVQRDYPEEMVYDKKRITSTRKSGMSPCGRCASIIDRHKKMYGVTDARWPYASFKEMASA